MRPSKCYSEPLQDFLANQTAAETIEVLEDVLQILVIHTEYVGLPDNFVHQYLTIKELRDLFVKLNESTSDISDGLCATDHG